MNSNRYTLRNRKTGKTLKQTFRTRETARVAKRIRGFKYVIVAPTGIVVR
jgi:hypothetical protein